jgi:SHS2 domain-containing protein
MPYKFLEDVGTADIAFEATGRDLPELFTAAADATMNVMIDNLDAIEARETLRIELSNDQIDMLLFDFLQELIYFKDARRLLLRAREIQIEQKDEAYLLKAKVAGERLDDARHQQRADVKAVTLHGFSVAKHDAPEAGWKAKVLLDI